SMAYPYGQYNSTVKQAAQDAGFAGARTSDFGFNDRASDLYQLKSLSVQRGGSCDGGVPATTLADIQGWIDTAALTKTWGILMFHQIDNSSASCYGITPTLLQDIVDYLGTADVDVV